MSALEWRRWERNLHTAPGKRNGESGSWSITKPIAAEPWELWFMPKGLGPKGRRAKRGQFVDTFKTLAAAKAEAEALVAA